MLQVTIRLTHNLPTNNYFTTKDATPYEDTASIAISASVVYSASAAMRRSFLKQQYADKE